MSFISSAFPVPPEDREYTTTITTQIVWTDPANGSYFPMTNVSGDIPDELDTTKLGQWMNQALHRFMTTPTHELPWE